MRFLFSEASRLEWLVLGIMVFATLAGIAISQYDARPFENRYVVEGGLIETLTVLFLLIGCICCFSKIAKRFKEKGIKGTLFLCVTGGLMLFASGEELSWGQHFFEYHSSEFFNANNTQGETNIHNLQLYGLKLNKIIFADLVALGLLSYLVLLPLTYARWSKMQEWVQQYGVCVPRWRHALLFLIAIGAGELIISERRSELDELSAVITFFTTILYPSNKTSG